MAEYKYQNTTQDDAGFYDQLTDKPATGRNVLWSDNPSKAGAGRGKQGGPTAKELQKYEDKQNEGIFVAGKKVPQDIDSGSAPRKSAQERMQEYRAQKKGIPVDEMRKKAGAEYDKKMKAGEFYAKGGMTASKRADGIAQRGKTRGKMC